MNLYTVCSVIKRAIYKDSLFCFYIFIFTAFLLWILSMLRENIKLNSLGKWFELKRKQGVLGAVKLKIMIAIMKQLIVRNCRVSWRHFACEQNIEDCRYISSTVKFWVVFPFHIWNIPYHFGIEGECCQYITGTERIISLRHF